MQVSAEFTIEPFVEGQPGAHVRAGLDALRDEGFAVEVGPFGSAIVGDPEPVAAALSRLVAAATANGATRVSLQVTVVEA